MIFISDESPKSINFIVPSFIFINVMIYFMFAEILRKILKMLLRNIVDTCGSTEVCQIFSATSLFREK